MHVHKPSTTRICEQPQHMRCAVPIHTPHLLASTGQSSTRHDRRQCRAAASSGGHAGRGTQCAGLRPATAARARCECHQQMQCMRPHARVWTRVSLQSKRLCTALMRCTCLQCAASCPPPRLADATQAPDHAWTRHNLASLRCLLPTWRHWSC